MTVTVQVNGVHRDVADGTTAADLLDLMGLGSGGIAIAVDGAVCPRREWTMPLDAGARVDILTAVQGG